MKWKVYLDNIRIYFDIEPIKIQYQFWVGKISATLWPILLQRSFDNMILRACCGSEFWNCNFGFFESSVFGFNINLIFKTSFQHRYAHVGVVSENFHKKCQFSTAGGDKLEGKEEEGCGRCATNEQENKEAAAGENTPGEREIPDEMRGKRRRRRSKIK